MSWKNRGGPQGKLSAAGPAPWVPRIESTAPVRGGEAATSESSAPLTPSSLLPPRSHGSTSRLKEVVDPKQPPCLAVCRLSLWGLAPLIQVRRGLTKRKLDVTTHVCSANSDHTYRVMIDPSVGQNVSHVFQYERGRGRTAGAAPNHNNSPNDVSTGPMHVERKMAGEVHNWRADGLCAQRTG